VFMVSGKDAIGQSTPASPPPPPPSAPDQNNSGNNTINISIN
jgi:hypothetical protein